MLNIFKYYFKCISIKFYDYAALCACYSSLQIFQETINNIVIYLKYLIIKVIFFIIFFSSFSAKKKIKRKETNKEKQVIFINNYIFKRVTIKLKNYSEKNFYLTYLIFLV